MRNSERLPKWVYTSNILTVFQERNRGSATDDLYNFHEAVSLLMETEEQVIDEHKSSMEVSLVGSNGIADLSISLWIGNHKLFDTFTLFKRTRISFVQIVLGIKFSCNIRYHLIKIKVLSPFYHKNYFW